MLGAKQLTVSTFHSSREFLPHNEEDIYTLFNKENKWDAMSGMNGEDRTSKYAVL